MAMKYVYLVRAGTNHYKVGVAHNVTKRVKAIQTSNAQEIELVTARLVYDSSAVEKSLHTALKELKMNGGREWFELNDNDALRICVLLNKNPEISLADQLVSHVKDNLLSIVEAYETKIEEHLKIPKEVMMPYKLPPIKKYPNDYTLITEAIKIFNEEGKASTSLLQRRLQIGYGKAARIMDKLEQQGKLTRLNGNRTRQLI